MEKVRFAVVGVGGLGVSHLTAIQNNSKIAECTAICDINEEFLKSRGDRFGVERRYTDYYKMLEDGGFDCVCVRDGAVCESASAAAAESVGAETDPG